MEVVGGTEAGTESGKPKRKTASGRKDSNKQAAVPDEKKLDAGMEEVVELMKLADKANERVSETVKELAKDSGFLASVVRCLARAKVKNNVGDKKREIGQMHLAFGCDE